MGEHAPPSDTDPFEAAVARALASIPEELWAQVDNVEVFVEEAAPDDPHVYGEYRGVPLGERGSGYAGALPDGIAIYRRPLMEEFGHDPELLEREIRITVLHEVGHYFGMSEERLRALGYE